MGLFDEESRSNRIIGIVGGMGPYTGLDLCKKVLDQTIAITDQEHFSFILFSLPEQIEDRTAFLLNQSTTNPGLKIAELIKKMEESGAGIVGIPCNTVHVPEIYDCIQNELVNLNCKIKLVNMIQEVLSFIQVNYPTRKNIGILSTTGTYKSDIYRIIFEPEGFNVIMPTEKMQNELIHEAIYNKEYGIKGHASPINVIAEDKLLQAIAYFQEQKADLVVLACTEICLAIAGKQINDLVVVDTTQILARALIREIEPSKLKALI